MKREEKLSLKELLKPREKGMKATDLRIGNIVTHDDYSDEIFEVISIKLEKEGYVIDTKGGKNGTWLNHIDLITKVPITKEWMDKLGFCHNKKNNLFYWGRYAQIEFNLEKLQFFSYSNDLSVMLLTKKIEYIHELQNLCFQFEKKELLKIVKVWPENNDLPI